jgi:2-haloacid dehalogenase
MTATVAVFDVGRVLIEWDPSRLYRQVFAGDAARVEWFLAEVCHAAWNREQDRGRPWAEGIAEAVTRHPSMRAEIEAYRARWHEMVAADIPGSVALLRALKACGVPLFAITNFAADTFAEITARFDFFALFDGIVVSGTERVLKPDPAIFGVLAQRHGVALQDCLFIDDIEENIAGARAVGMHGHLFTTPEALRVELLAHGMLPG